MLDKLKDPTFPWQKIEDAPYNTKVFARYLNKMCKDRFITAIKYRVGTFQAHEDYEGDDVDENGYFINDKWVETCESNPDGIVYDTEFTPTHFIRLDAPEKLAQALRIAVEALFEIECNVGIRGDVYLANCARKQIEEVLNGTDINT